MAEGRRTDWGEAVAWVLTKYILELNEQNGVDPNYFGAELPPEADFGFLRPAFQPMFPSWQKIYALDREPVKTAAVLILELLLEDRPVWATERAPDRRLFFQARPDVSGRHGVKSSRGRFAPAPDTPHLGREYKRYGGLA